MKENYILLMFEFIFQLKLMEHVFRWFVNNFYNSNSDINECDTSISPSGKCGGNAICSNSPGGFSCACKPGFTGDPFVNCYGKCRKIPKFLPM